jgi:hypothetical protein
MGLIRGVARTAAIAGTATAVSNRVSRRQAGRWAEQEQQQAYQQQEPYQQQPVYQQPAYQEPPPQPPPAMSTEPPPPAEQEMGDKLAQLQQLGALKSQGILTDEEFEAQKKKILGG